MFNYNNEELIQIVNDRVTNSGQDVECRLRVICRIAAMMRKFEKLASEHLKNSLVYIFDKEQAIHQLQQESDPLSAFNSVEQLANLVYFIRKFDFDWKQMATIYEKTDFAGAAFNHLKSFQNETSEANFERVYLLSLALKYLCRNSCKTTTTTSCSSVVDPLIVLDLVSSVADDAVKTELVWTIGYLIQIRCQSRDDPNNKTLW